MSQSAAERRPYDNYIPEDVRSALGAIIGVPLEPLVPVNPKSSLAGYGQEAQIRISRVNDVVVEVLLSGDVGDGERDYMSMIGPTLQVQKDENGTPVSVVFEARGQRGIVSREGLIFARTP